MFWDKIACLYDLFENLYNKKVYTETGKRVAGLLRKTDDVLECACGTGAISKYISDSAHQLTATDFSEGMLKQAKKNLKSKQNIAFAQVDITNLPYEDHSFDAVVAGNVIHLLQNPQKAMKELMRVCKRNGKVIIPTYINDSEKSSRIAVKLLIGSRIKLPLKICPQSFQQFYGNLMRLPMSSFFQQWMFKM